jgi:hypothetical protein
MLSVLGRNVAAAALAVGLVGVAASCSDSDTGATTNTVTIKPSSYVVREQVTTSTAPADTGPDAEGRCGNEQTYTVQDDDFPIMIADLYEIEVEELRNYNGWDAEYNDFPNAGGTVRIPPGAKCIDPTTLTTTTTTTEPTATDESTPAEGSTEGTEAGAPQGCTPGNYTVEDGDNPTLIAQKFDVTLEALTEANGWDAEYSNFQATGETVVIPPSATCESTTSTPG